MYKIYADGKLLYSPHLFHEGCGVLSPKLTTELNKAGSLEFTLPPTNSLYDEIDKLKTIITAYQDDELIFRGRVLHDEKDFYKQKKVYCEGQLAFMLDSIQRPYSFIGTVEEYFKMLIANHNARVNKEKQFTVGNVTVGGTISYVNSDYPTTIDELNTQIIDYFGGQLKTRVSNGIPYIDLIDYYDDENFISQTIEFGTNLLDLSEHITAENIITVLVPIGAALYDEEGNMIGKLDITSVNDGKDYLENETAIALFGRIESMQEWSDIEDASLLLEEGQYCLDLNIEMAVTLTIKAIDLHLLNIDVDMIRVGCWVRVISLPHGLDQYFQCTKIVYDMANPDQNEYVFGVNYTTLTERQVSGEKTIISSTSGIQSAIISANTSASKANQASKDAETVIATLPTEYVQTATFEAYKEEINTKFDSYALQTDLEELVERVTALEGGTE